MDMELLVSRSLVPETICSPGVIQVKLTLYQCQNSFPVLYFLQLLYYKFHQVHFTTPYPVAYEVKSFANGNHYWSNIAVICSGIDMIV